MEWITQSRLRINEYLKLELSVSFPELYSIASDLQEGISPQLIIAVSCCKAVGGNPENAIELAAGLLSVMMGVRILDDLQDRDKTEALYLKVGPARAFNYAYGFSVLGYKIFTEMNCEEPLKRKLLDTFNEGSLITLQGQDRDLQGINSSWEDYWKTAEMKTCYITSTGAAMGAMVGTTNEDLIKACRLYGYHWGLALQILNDMEGVWDQDGESDLGKGKVTLPVLYALNCKHDEKEELEVIVSQGNISRQAGRVKEILDRVDAKSYLIWAALEQRKKALAAIAICPDEEGKNALTYFLNGMFGDIDELLEKKEKHSTVRKRIRKLNTLTDERAK